MVKQSGRAAHTCRQGEKIAEMYSKIERLDKIVNGNGQEGLHATVIKLNASLKKFSEETELLARSVSGLVKFQTEIEITSAQKAKYLAQREKEKNTESARRRWVMGTIITLVSIIAGLVIALIK